MDVPYFLSKYDPDALRFYLTAVAPEARDTEFAWEDFVERNNHVLSGVEGNELVAVWDSPYGDGQSYAGLCLQTVRWPRAGAWGVGRCLTPSPLTTQPICCILHTCK